MLIDVIVSIDWFSSSDEAGSSLRVRHLSAVSTLLTVAHVQHLLGRVRSPRIGPCSMLQAV